MDSSKNGSRIIPFKKFSRGRVKDIDDYYFTGKEKCSDSTENWEDVVTGRSDDIYNTSNDYIAMFHEKYTYLVNDRSKAAILKIKLNEKMSLLKAVRKPTKVYYDTLSANMTMNGTHWIIRMTGQVEDCPGLFKSVFVLFSFNILSFFI